MSRQSSYSQEAADAVCAALVEGYSLRTVCKREDMPPLRTVMNWLSQNEAFRQQYARAKEEQADTLVEEMLDIADDATNDWMVRTGKDGEDLGWQLNGDHVRRSALRIDTRKWIASKMKPKKYGVDRVDLTSGDEPIKNLSDAQLWAVINGTTVESDQSSTE